MTKTEKTVAVTKCPTGIAMGLEGPGGENSRRALQNVRGQTTPRQEPEVQVAKVVKAGKATKPAKKAAKAAPKGSTLSLKQNAEVRSLLTKAAQAAGGTRLSPVGFASYTDFLAGVPLDADGNAEVVFIPVKGNAPIQGKNVKLTIKAGKVAKVK